METGSRETLEEIGRREMHILEPHADIAAARSRRGFFGSEGREASGGDGRERPDSRFPTPHSPEWSDP